MKRTNIYLTDDQHKKLTRDAKKSGLTMADIVRRILDAHYSKELQDGQRHRKRRPVN